MSKYMRLEMWIDRIQDTISTWEKLQAVKIPENVKKSIVKFMRGKIKKGIEQRRLYEPS